MNQSLLNLEYHSFNNNINIFQKYEICRQQSKCYLLTPPPQPPILPKLILTKNLHQSTNSYFIIFGIFITLISVCLILFLFGVIFLFYRKLRQRYRRTKDKNTTDEPSSFSSIVPTSYTSLTPLTTTINQSPSLTMTNKSNLSFQQHLNSDHRSFYHNHSLNIYEEIRLSSDHYYSYYQQKHQLMPYYELSSTKIICQNCLLETLHRKKQCLCHNFFVPIK